MKQPSKKTASILSRLTANLQWRRLSAALGMDAALLIVAVCTWCYASEKPVCTGWEPFLPRTFSLGQTGVWLARLRAA